MLYVISIGWVVQIVNTSISVISHKSLPSISILASKSLHHFSRQALLGVGAPLSWWMTKRPGDGDAFRPRKSDLHLLQLIGQTTHPTYPSIYLGLHFLPAFWCIPFIRYFTKGSTDR